MQEREYQQKMYFTAVIVGGILFILLYSMLSFFSRPMEGNRIFNSPDETSNFYFTRLFTEKNSLSFYEPLNSIYDNVIYPRGTAVNEAGAILPGSFLGIIFLYGLIAKFFGSWIIVYLTPVFACFGSIYFFKLIKRVFSERIALISTILLWVLPAWWYYSSRSMFHNVLFVTLAIITFYHLVVFLQERSVLHWIGALAFLALTLITRLSEAPWLGGLFFTILLFQKNSVVSWRKKLLSLMALGFFGSIIFGLQGAVFNHSLTGAYGADLTSADWTEELKRLFFPFGFDFIHSLKNAFWFLGYFFWWYSIGVSAGLVFLFIRLKKLSNPQRVYIFSFLSITTYLVFYYGSWWIGDHIGTDWLALDVSYVRYWLPVYVMALPFFGSILEPAAFVADTQRLRKSVLFLIALVYAGAGYVCVYTRPMDGLAAVEQSLQSYYQKRSTVMHLVEPQAVIVTERSDKIFFPTLSVVSAVNDPRVLTQVYKMVEAGEPVYWYSHYSGKDEDIFGARLAEKGLGLTRKTFIGNEEFLFKLQTTTSDHGIN